MRSTIRSRIQRGEPGRMLRSGAYVFVHVEDHDVAPGNIRGLGDQDVDEQELRVTGGEHGVRRAALTHSRPEDRRGVVGRRSGEVCDIGVHVPAHGATVGCARIDGRWHPAIEESTSS